MTIQEEIDADLKNAMRARDAERLSVLRMVKSALTNAAIEKHGAVGGLADTEAVGVIRKQVKQRMDSIESFEKGGRPELAAKERKEIDFLAVYLPKPLTEDEIDQLVKDAIAQAGATSKAQMGGRHENRYRKSRRPYRWKKPQPSRPKSPGVRKQLPVSVVSCQLSARTLPMQLEHDSLLSVSPDEILASTDNRQLTLTTSSWFPPLL
jgi:uncharacterized protein